MPRPGFPPAGAHQGLNGAKMVNQSIPPTGQSAPSPLCEDHKDGPSPYPCANCSDANLSRKRWDQKQQPPQPVSQPGQPPTYDSVRATLGIGTHYSKQGYLDATTELGRIKAEREAAAEIYKANAD